MCIVVFLVIRGVVWLSSRMAARLAARRAGPEQPPGRRDDGAELVLAA